MLKGIDFETTTIDVVSIESNLHSGAPYYRRSSGIRWRIASGSRAVMLMNFGSEKASRS